MSSNYFRSLWTYLVLGCVACTQPTKITLFAWPGGTSHGFLAAVIADKLSISEHTVASHMKAIYSKLDVHSKTEAVYKALIQMNTVSL